MSADPGTGSAPSRRTRIVAVLIAVLVVLVVGLVASRRIAVNGPGPVEVGSQGAQQASEDCEEEPPPTSITLAECGADEPAGASGSSPPAQP